MEKNVEWNPATCDLVAYDLFSGRKLKLLVWQEFIIIADDPKPNEKHPAHQMIPNLAMLI